MSISGRSNRIFVFGTVAVFVVMGLIWRQMLRPLQDQMLRARRNGVTPEGGLPAPLERRLNTRTALHHDLIKAAEQGQWEPIQDQLAEGMSPDEHVGGETLMMIAAQHGQLNVMRRLYGQGSKVDARDGHGNTALMYASRYGQTEAARFLLEHGANLRMRNGYKLTAMDLAVMGQHETIYGLLKSRGATVNLVQAVQMNDRKAIDTLLKAKPNINATYPTTASSSSRARGDLGLNVGAGASPGPLPTDLHNYMAPLAGAAETGHLDVAALLIARGARVNQKEKYGETALSYAAGSGNLNTVRFLLQQGATVDEYSLVCARDSAKSSRSEIMSLLRQAQATKK